MASFIDFLEEARRKLKQSLNTGVQQTHRFFGTASNRLNVAAQRLQAPDTRFTKVSNFMNTAGREWAVPTAKTLGNAAKLYTKATNPLYYLNKNVRRDVDNMGNFFDLSKGNLFKTTDGYDNTRAGKVAKGTGKIMAFATREIPQMATGQAIGKAVGKGALRIAPSIFRNVAPYSAIKGGTEFGTYSGLSNLLSGNDVKSSLKEAGRSFAIGSVPIGIAGNMPNFDKWGKLPRIGAGAITGAATAYLTGANPTGGAIIGGLSVAPNLSRNWLVYDADKKANIFQIRHYTDDDTFYSDATGGIAGKIAKKFKELPEEKAKVYLASKKYDKLDDFINSQKDKTGKITEEGKKLATRMWKETHGIQPKVPISQKATQGASKAVSLDRKLPQRAKQISTSIETKPPLVREQPVVKSPNLAENPKTVSLAKNVAPEPAKVNVDPVQKITNLLKEAKPLSMEQKALTSKRRGQQFAKMMSARGRTSGEKGYFAELGALKGGAKKVDFQSIRPKLKQTDIDSLFDRVNNANIGEWEKINAKSSLAKLLSKEGATIPTQNELKLLNDVFGNDFTRAILDKRSTWQKFMSGAGEVLNLPRSLMASFDLSAPLRQGIFLVGRPKQWVSAFTSMFKQFGSEKAYKAVQESIQAKPNYKIMRQARLAITDVGNLATGREEQFMSNIAEKIPLVGKGVRASGRAYTGFLNKLRADVFDDLYSKAKSLGQDSPEMADDIAKFVNSATGRGDLGKLNNAATALNSVFFSPRLMASRMNLLNPIYYAQLNPMVRKEALKSLLTFGAVAGTVLGLAKAGGADIGTDPRSADFGKIKVGDTRYDILGGFQQYIVLASRLLSGKMVSSTTGKEISLTEGYKPTTRKDIIINFLQSKENPILSYLTNWAEGTTQLGQKFRPVPELIDRMIPMLAQDLVELSEDKGFAKAFGMTLPAFFGTGVQTYGKQIPNMNEKGKLEWRNPPSTGERIYNKLTGQQISNVPADQQKTLSDQRRIELQNKADLDTAKAKVIKQKDSVQTVGDKVIYWDEENEQIKTITKQKYNLMEFEKQYGENDLVYSKYSLEADRLKDDKDMSGWMKKTEEYLGYYEKYISQLDPNSKEYFTAVKRYENLLDTASKYAGYGGFTKPKSGGSGGSGRNPSVTRAITMAKATHGVSKIKATTGSYNSAKSRSKIKVAVAPPSVKIPISKRYTGRQLAQMR